MSETLFDTCVFWSCVTRCGCRTTSSTLFTVDLQKKFLFVYVICYLGEFFLQSDQTQIKSCQRLYHSIYLIPFISTLHEPIPSPTPILRAKTQTKKQINRSIDPKVSLSGSVCASANDSQKEKGVYWGVLQRKFETNVPRNETAQPRSQLLHSCICELFIYSHQQSFYFA